MTAAGELLAAEIRRDGPIPFRRFMEVALYHPDHGYYRHPRDPFGKAGDFFTAEQVQPVFGTLMAARLRQLWRSMGEPQGFTVVELGAGRGEMASAFAEWRYLPIDLDSGELPAEFEGVVFANEFFDALPVEAAVFAGGEFRERRVTLAGDAFVWSEGDRVSDRVEHYLRRWFPPPEEGRCYEANLNALAWIERLGRSLHNGYLLTIDYGFTRQESIRFPAGTLMGYRRHTAHENVMEDPGARDITAHVNFSALEEAGAECGLVTERFETLAQTILAAGEADQFGSVLASANPAEELRRRMQLKTLLFGMGETFRVLLQRKRP
jgi:SAM-dependent MidA family methyltransferase